MRHQNRRRRDRRRPKNVRQGERHAEAGGDVRGQCFASNDTMLAILARLSEEMPHAATFKAIAVQFRLRPYPLAGHRTRSRQVGHANSEPACLRRIWTTRPVKIIAVAAVALFAAANTFASAAENSTRIAREHQACAVIMGLHQPGDLYDTCIRSLDKTLSELDRAGLVSANRTTCAREGLKPGTPAFAVCVVDAERFLAGVGRNAAVAAAR